MISRIKSFITELIPIQHSLIYVFGTLLSGSVSLITFPILARLISVKEFGEYDFFLFLLLSSVPLTTLGIEYGLGAFAHETGIKDISRILKKLLPITLTLALLFTAAIFGIKLVGIFQTFSYRLICLWGLCLATLSFCTILKSVFFWRQHPIRATIVIHGEWIAGSIIGLSSVIILGHSVENYLLGFTIAFILSSILASLLWPKNTTSFSPSKIPITAKEILKISWPYAITNTLFVLSLGIEKSIILKLCGPSSLGIYAMASKVGNIAQLIGINFIFGFLPQLIKEENNQHLYKLLAWLYVVYSITFLLVVILFHKQIILFFGGSKYIASSYLLIYTTIASLLSLIPLAMNAYLLRRKYTLPILYYGISSTLFIIISSPLLLKLLNLSGAAIAVILGRFVGISVLWLTIRQHKLQFSS